MKKSLALVIITLLFYGCVTTNSADQVFDTIVIGGGLMGSSTAWHLSDQGSSVLLLEKQDSIYTEGSSFGDARIARSSNRGNDIWSYLHNSSVAETQKLIAYLQKADVSHEYKMEDVYTTLPVTYVGRTTIYERLYASLIRQKVDYEMAVTPEEAKSKFDVVLPDSVLLQREYNKFSGTVNPHKLIQYLHKAIVQKGNKIQYNRKVLDVKFNENSQLYEITYEDGKKGGVHLLHTKKVISAAGPYTGKLLENIAPYFDTLINPQRVFLAFLKINKEAYEKLSHDEKTKILDYYPVINSSKGTRDGSFFSMIEYFDEYNIPVIKIGGHFQRSEIAILDDVWSQELSDSEINWSISSTHNYFKQLNLPIAENNIELVKGYSCVYSLTGTEIPFVTPIINKDQSPNENFIVLGGLSGVGAKGAMTYGLLAANTLNKKTRNDSMYLHVTQELGFERLKSVVGN